MSEKTEHASRKLWLWIPLGFFCTVLLAGILLWPWLNRLIPEKHYSGVELYHSNAYLQFEKGELFSEQLMQLPFSSNAEILSFDYYDFYIRDPVWENQKYSDLYMVQIKSNVSFAEITQYLEDHCIRKDDNPVSGSTIYCLYELESDDSVYVAVNHLREEVYCLLITNDSACIMGERFLYLNFSKMPWE